MNKSELKEYIKERIREALTIDVPQDPGQLTTTQKRQYIQNLKVGEKDTNIGGPKKPVEFIEGIDLNEMARQASIVKIDPDFREKAKEIKTGGPISPVKLKDVLDFLEGKTETTGPAIAAGVGFPGKMPRIYPIYKALLDAGALIGTSNEKTEEIPDTPENEEAAELFYSDVYDKSSADPEEDEFEKEPEMGSIEKSSVSTLDPITQKATEFTLDNGDLIQSVIKAYKDSRIRLGALREEEGDLSAADYKKALKQSKEAGVERLQVKLDSLIAKIANLEPEVQDKVLKTLDYKFRSVNANKLTDIITKKLGRTLEPTNSNDEDEILDLDDEEITEDSGVEDVDYGGSSFKDYDSIYESLTSALKGITKKK
jgi:hypothetical protein